MNVGTDTLGRLIKMAHARGGGHAVIVATTALQWGRVFDAAEILGNGALLPNTW